MKRSKIILCIAALLLFAVLLSSCGATKISPIKNLSKVLNADYDLAYESYKEGSELKELKGYKPVMHYNDATGDEELYHSDEFLIFFKVETDGKTTQKVFSFRSGSVILELKNTKDTAYSVDFVEDQLTGEDQPVFVVTKTVIDTESEEEDVEPEVTYTLYDATAQEVAKSEIASDVKVVADYIIFNYVAYTADKDGKLTKAFDLPEYMNVDFIVYYNDVYFYSADEMGVYVYDTQFNRVSAWFVPEYDDESLYDLDMFILNNGDILVQYMVVLDEDAAKYDITTVVDGETLKIDLASVLVSAKNGKAKTLELDYIIDNIESNYDLYDEDEDDNAFTNGFENIAYICPIVDGKILNSPADRDVVLMNNKAKITKSLKVVDYQVAEVPTKISDGRYAVSTLDGGMVVIDEKGEVIHSINNFGFDDIVGAYFVGERAIYDMDLNVAYDLAVKNVEVVEVIGDTIFIKKGTAKEYSIISLCGGEEKTVYTYTEDTEKLLVFTNGMYYLVDEDGNYEYFNEKGESLVKISDEHGVFAKSEEHGVIVFKTADIVDAKYYVIKK